MKGQISKARLKKVGSRERKSNVPSEIVAFRNGNALAVLYACLTGAAGVLCMLWSYPVSLEVDWKLRLPIGIAILFVALLCSRLLLGLFAPEILKRNSRLLMLCTVSAFSLALSAACVTGAGTLASTPALTNLISWDLVKAAPFLFPHLLAPALATLLSGPAAGISVGVGVTIANTAFIQDESVLPAIVMGLIASVLITEIVAKVRRRFALLRVFMLGGAIQFLGVIVYAASKMAQNGPFTDLGPTIAFCTAALVFSTGLAFAAIIILLPLHEHFFGACSNIRLNEFADLSNPLLQKLSLEAPGTYHHSIVVATLASAAAERIGANALLARVASYYHDIGKITKPVYYTENTRGEHQSPHENISPNMSAVIIGAHVKEGIGLALHYNLPPPVRDVIREHHGTSIMTWFHHKAKEEARQKVEASGKEPDPVDESQFRYSGPRPTSRESGIVLLADSVEAASRSLERTTNSAIENLVDNIVRGKIDDEQLDCCQLSFIDVAIIKRTFTTTLSNILHPRIAYPKDDDTKESLNEDNHRNTATVTAN